MTPRRCFLFVLTVALALFTPGCALAPDHVSVGYEHDEAEAEGQRGLHTATRTNKFDVRATYDLKHD